jgi:hypothetical protein
MTEKHLQGFSELLRQLTVPLVVIILGYFSANLVSMNTQLTVLTTKVAILENTLTLYLNSIKQVQH